MAGQPGALIIGDPCEEYDFVDRLPDEYTCSVCLDVLREPHLTTCCGRHFCKRCIERVLNYGKPCPLCKHPGFVAVIDKSVERRILAMKVRCPFTALGCDWVGEMRRQPDHLDLEKGQCEHRHIKCPNGCGMLVPKAELEGHLADYCPKRKLICHYCSQYSTYGDIEEHNRTCPDYPVRCPNECSNLRYPRSSLGLHLPQCPCRPVPCEFQRTGCTAQVRQNDMAHHLETASQAHLSQVSQFCVDLMHGLQEKDDQTAELQRQLREKDQEIAQLRDALRKVQVDFEGQLQVQKDLIRSRLRESNGQMETLELQLQAQAGRLEDATAISQRVQILETLINTPPYYFTMTNFSLHKRGGTQWMCPAFYNELGGYKMALEISAFGEGAGKGTHVSVYVRILRGEYDDHIQWPLKASVTIQLISQLNEDHYEMTTPVYEWTRVREGVVGVGWGWDRFIPHANLDLQVQRRTEFLRNDRLNFRIICVDKSYTYM